MAVLTRSAERLLRRVSAPAAAAALLVVASAAAFLARVLAWPPAVTFDPWAYAAWGQALARGERPLYDLGATTPKPLANVFGAAVVMLPPARGMAVVVALSLGVLVASLFVAASRDAGGLAGVVAVAALVFGVGLDGVLAFAYIDGVTAALIVLAIALRGRWRIAALVLAGLLRPEAWPLAAVAGFSETRGHLPRRLAAAGVAGVASPLLWMLWDSLSTGDPLGTVHWIDAYRTAWGAGSEPWSDLLPLVVDRLAQQSSLVVLVAGLVGLLVHGLRAWQNGRFDPLPLAVVLIWTGLVAAETHGGGLLGRYLFPVAAVLALGCGLLAGSATQRFSRGPLLPAAAVAVVLLVLAVSVMDLPPGTKLEIARNRAAQSSLPAMESVSECGRLGVVRDRRSLAIIPQLAAASRQPLNDFGFYRSSGDYGAVLRYAWERYARRGKVRSRDRMLSTPLPDWPAREIPLGRLLVAPGCQFGLQG